MTVKRTKAARLRGIKAGGRGVKYTFKAHVYAPPFTPYYDAYKGHVFVIDHYHKEASDHVWLTCVDDPSVKVAGYVELDDLEEAKEEKAAAGGKED